MLDLERFIETVEAVEALPGVDGHRAEGELAEQYFPGDTMAVEKFRELQRTDSVVAELPGLPAEVSA